MGLRLGADDYITKPFSPARLLLERIRAPAAPVMKAGQGPEGFPAATPGRCVMNARRSGCWTENKHQCHLARPHNHSADGDRVPVGQGGWPRGPAWYQEAANPADRCRLWREHLLSTTAPSTATSSVIRKKFRHRGPEEGIQPH